MAIKRLTIELDDHPETDMRTSPPSSLMPKPETLPGHHEVTDVPDQQQAYRAADAGKEGLQESTPKELIGRTPSDLVYAFINRPEVMATTLTFLALLITVGKIEESSDWWLTFAAAVILNAVWFGVVLVRWLCMSSDN